MYKRQTELTEVSGTGIDVVTNLPKWPVPVLMLYQTYRSVRYRYEVCTEHNEVFGTGCRTELTEVCGTGIDVAPILPKCPAPVLPAVCTGGMPWYVPYRTHPSIVCVCVLHAQPVVGFYSSGPIGTGDRQRTAALRAPTMRLTKKTWND